MSSESLNTYESLYKSIFNCSILDPIDIPYSELQALFAYQSFDPKQCLEKLAKVKTEDHEGDLYKMCFLFLSIGSNLEYIKAKSSAQFSNEIDTLKTRYGLISSVKGKGRDAINLARVASSCPILTVTILASCPDISRPVSRIEMNNLVPGWPSVLLSTITASVVPTTHPNCKQILECLMLYNALESKKISKTAKKSPKEALIEAAKFVNSSFYSPAITNEDRIKFANSGVTSEAFTADEIKDVVARGAEMYLSYFNKSEW